MIAVHDFTSNVRSHCRSLTSMLIKSHPLEGRTGFMLIPIMVKAQWEAQGNHVLLFSRQGTTVSF